MLFQIFAASFIQAAYSGINVSDCFRQYMHCQRSHYKWCSFVISVFSSRIDCLTIGHCSVSVHLITSNNALVTAWTIHKLFAQSSALRFMQDNTWIVPIQTLHIAYAFRDSSKNLLSRNMQNFSPLKTCLHSICTGISYKESVLRVLKKSWQKY